MKRAIKPVDILVFAGLVGFSGRILYASFFSTTEKARYAHVEVSGRHFIYSLDGNWEHSFSGRLGEFRVSCEEGEVFVSSSNCPEALCMRERISGAGDSIVCLPNMISVRLSTDVGGPSLKRGGGISIDDVSW